MDGGGGQARGGEAALSDAAVGAPSPPPRFRRAAVRPARRRQRAAAQGARQPQRPQVPLRAPARLLAAGGAQGAASLRPELRPTNVQDHAQARPLLTFEVAARNRLQRKTAIFVPYVKGSTVV